jgi:hypothetical protein
VYLLNSWLWICGIAEITDSTIQKPVTINRLFESGVFWIFMKSEPKNCVKKVHKVDKTRCIVYLISICLLQQVSMKNQFVLRIYFSYCAIRRLKYIFFLTVRFNNFRVLYYGFNLYYFSCLNILFGCTEVSKFLIVSTFSQFRW